MSVSGESDFEHRDFREELNETDGDFLRLVVNEFNGETDTGELKDRCGYDSTESVKYRVEKLAEFGLATMEDGGTDRHGRPLPKVVKATRRGAEVVWDDEIPGDGTSFNRTTERVKELEDTVEYLELVVEELANEMEINVEVVDGEVVIEEQEEYEDWADVDVWDG